MGGFLVFILIVVLAVIIFKTLKSPSSEPKSFMKESTATDNIAEAKRHYKKGNNLWAEDFHAALAEFEIALRLDPNNVDYKLAVDHAKRNIELDKENG